jgi:hypothetical protein
VQQLAVVSHSTWSPIPSRIPYYDIRAKQGKNSQRFLNLLHQNVNDFLFLFQSTVSMELCLFRIRTWILQDRLDHSLEFRPPLLF